jgi:hypothetical protein
MSTLMEVQGPGQVAADHGEADGPIVQAVPKAIARAKAAEERAGSTLEALESSEEAPEAEAPGQDPAESDAPSDEGGGQTAEDADARETDVEEGGDGKPKAESKQGDRLSRRLVHRDRELAEERRLRATDGQTIRDLQAHIAQVNSVDDVTLLRHRTAARMNTSANDPRISEALMAVSRQRTLTSHASGCERGR